CVGTTVGAYW
nr:immunoglobulin heavy chain junction region [Mus musculus]